MKWLLAILIGLGSLRAHGEEEQSYAEARLRTWLEVYRGYENGSQRPRFDLEGNEVGWEVSDHSQGFMDFECTPTNEFSYHLRDTVDLVDMVGSISKPSCDDLDKQAVLKICQYMVKKNASDSEKIDPIKKVSCTNRTQNPFNSMSYPFVDDGKM